MLWLNNVSRNIHDLSEKENIGKNLNFEIKVGIHTVILNGFETSNKQINFLET